MEYPIQGSCQCGQVTYKLFKPPGMVVACHCTECQKLSTSPFSITALIDAKDIEFEGELKEWSRLADNGNRNNAKFCPCCGNRVYHYNPDKSETVKLKLKQVNPADDSVFKPFAHIWVCQKQSWYEIPDDVEVYEKQF